MKPQFFILKAIILKEFQLLRHDKRLLMMLFVAPLLQILMFGYAISYDVKSLTISYCNQDHSELSRKIELMIKNDETFIFQECSSLVHPQEAILNHHAQGVLYLPPSYEASLKEGKPQEAQILVDASNPIVAKAMASSLENLLLSSSFKIKPSLNITPFYNPSFESRFSMVPGVTALVLLIITMLATSMGLAKEKELGIQEQIMVTPVSSLFLVLGKVIPFMMIGIFDVLLVLLLALWHFEIPFIGSLFIYFIFVFLFLISTISGGIYIACISSNQQQAFLTGFLIMVPAVLLSGVMTPISTMPSILKIFTYINPIRYFVEASRGIFLKGTSFEHLGIQLLALILISSILLALSIRKYQKQDLG